MPRIPRRIAVKLAMLPTFAAAMAFYFLISLVPFLIVVTRGVAWIFSANLTPSLVFCGAARRWDNCCRCRYSSPASVS